MKIQGKTFGEERALYGSDDIELQDCAFAGEEDGESALKECGNVAAKACLFDLRYPLWHDKSVRLDNCTLTENCRAALWYSENITAHGSKLHGIKAVRECKNAKLIDCDIISPEFGWMTNKLAFTDCFAQSEYFCFRARNVKGERLKFKGKYSFQYVRNGKFTDCEFDTKDAFWHSKNITVINSVIKGEYLAWYSENLKLINCEIIGTQPLCYCKGLTLINCVMRDTDLAFEKSQVVATINSHIDSVKNPYEGSISAPSIGEIILDDPKAKAKIITG